MTDLNHMLDALDSSRERLLVAIELLPDEALQQPGAVGDWSVADVLVNLTVWEAELVTGLMHLDQGKRPDRLLAALQAPDAFDARRQAENQGRDLDRVFDDWQQVRVQLEEWLELLPLRALTDRQRFAWLDGRSVWQVIKETILARERRFLSPVRDFARQWGARPPSIPLTTISVEQENDGTGNGHLD